MTRNCASAGDKHGAFLRSRTKLLGLLLREKARRKQKITAYPQGDCSGPVRVPASWAQQRLWLIDQSEGGAACHFPTAWRLRGDLDQEALQRGLDTLVKRHEVLRTIFVSEESAPRQEIAAEGRFALHVTDLSGC